MMKKLLICVLLIALVLTGCGKKKPTMDEATVPTATTKPATLPTEATTQATTEATTEPKIPGVEDSIFGDNGEIVTKPTEATTPTTAPAQTQPTTDSTIPDKPSGSEGLQEPDAPEIVVPEETEATEPEDTEPEDTEPAESEETETTEPEETEPEETEPEETEPEETTPPPAEGPSEYERFQDMSPSEQQEYMEGFDSIEDFFDWYDKAKQEYDDANPPIEVGGGSIDLDDIIGDNG